MNQVSYIAAFRAEAAGGYSVSFPDVPGAISEGDDLQEAILNAREALELILEAHAEAGEPLPSASEAKPALDAVIAVGGLPFIITANAPSKATRINITIDEGLLDRINRAVHDRGQNRSAFFADAARKALRDAS